MPEQYLLLGAHKRKAAVALPAKPCDFPKPPLGTITREGHSRQRQRRLQTDSLGSSPLSDTSQAV